MIASSDPSQGATNISSDGSTFEILLSTPITIPKNAINCTLACEESSIWWTIPNVISGVNDKFYIYGDNNLAVPVPQLFSVTIPQGLYDLSGLQTSLLYQLESLGARTTPSPLVNLLADTNTQKCILRFNYNNVYVNFTLPNTINNILGFSPIVYGPYGVIPQNVIAPNVAQFNQINFFFLTCDLTIGFRFNNVYSSIISKVNIDVAPGSQIVNAPYNASRIQCDELIGSKRNIIRFRLTDDKLRSVNTNGEYFSMRIVIRYQELYEK